MSTTVISLDSLDAVEITHPSDDPAQMSVLMQVKSMNLTMVMDIKNLRELSGSIIVALAAHDAALKKRGLFGR